MRFNFMSTLLFLVSFQAFANFELPGKGFVIYPSGIKKTFDFGFKWDKTRQQFTVGGQSYAMSQIPDSYSIALTLTNDHQGMYVQEFAQGFITEFEWTIGPHVIKLVKQRFKWPVKGDYVLSVDDNRYFLAQNNASVKFVFNDKGINYITPIGITRDNGRKR